MRLHWLSLRAIMSYLHSWLYYIIFNDLLMLELFIYLVLFSYYIRVILFPSRSKNKLVFISFYWVYLILFFLWAFIWEPTIFLFYFWIFFGFHMVLEQNWSLMRPMICDIMWESLISYMHYFHGFNSIVSWLGACKGAMHHLLRV